MDFKRLFPIKVSLVMLLLIFTSAVISQNDTGLSRQNNVFNSRARFGSNGAQAAAQLISNPPRGVEGSPYLFESFKNNAVIVSTSGEQMRVLKNINFNVDRNTFESKIDSETVFGYDFTKIDKIVIGRRSFKRLKLESKEEYKIMEVIAENDTFGLYKYFTIHHREGSPNPMLSRPKDLLVLRDTYFIKDDDEVKKIKFKKPIFLQLTGSMAEDLEKFAEERDLNLRNEKDLEKQAMYYVTLK